MLPKKRLQKPITHFSNNERCFYLRTVIGNFVSDKVTVCKNHQNSADFATRRKYHRNDTIRLRFGYMAC